MLNLTCNVTGKYRTNGGVRYGLEPISSHVIVSSYSPPPCIDHQRAAVAVYDQAAADGLLRLNDLNPDDFVDGGCLIALGAMGWLHINVFLESGSSQSVMNDLDTSLANDNIMVSLSIDGIFSATERLKIEQWLVGERYSMDLRMVSRNLPEIGLVSYK